MSRIFGFKIRWYLACLHLRLQRPKGVHGGIEVRISSLPVVVDTFHGQAEVALYAQVAVFIYFAHSVSAPFAAVRSGWNKVFL